MGATPDRHDSTGKGTRIELASVWLNGGGVRAPGCHSQRPLSVRHVDASPVSRSVVRPAQQHRPRVLGRGGAVAVTSYAHFDGVSAVPDGPPHCVRFHVDAEGRCGVMSRAEAA